MLSGKYRFLDESYLDLVALCWDKCYDGSPHIDGQVKYWNRIDIFKLKELGAFTVSSLSYDRQWNVSDSVKKRMEF